MFYPGDTDELPPLLTSAACMANEGAIVRVFSSSSSPECSKYLREHRVQVSVQGNSRSPRSRLKRFAVRANLGARLLREIRGFRPDCIWYHSHDAMKYGLVPGALRSKLLVAHAHEMCDNFPLLRRIQSIILRTADLVITPEINRAWILKQQARTDAPFFIVPNRQLEDMYPDPLEGAITQAIYLENGGALSCKRFLLYQGAFFRDRCIPEIVQAFRMLKDPQTGLILLGYDPYSARNRAMIPLAEGDNRIVFVPRLAPPRHMLVTKGSFGGILCYAPRSLNNVYCAPNKLFEYAQYGLGLVLPDYPGIAAINQEYGLGYVCNPLEPTSILQAMSKLLSEPAATYRINSKRFLDRTPKPENVYSRIYASLLGLLQGRMEGCGDI